MQTRLTLLALGALTGLLVAASGLVSTGTYFDEPLATDVIARVGDRNIPLERYRELISDLETDKRSPIEEQDRQFVLDRLIDEELLILRGIEMGLAENAPQVRKAIAAAVIAQVAAEAEASPVEEADLRRFYSSNPEFFTSNARYRLRWWLLAASAHQRTGEDAFTEEVLLATGFKAMSLLPDELLPLTKISDYIGPLLAQQVAQLEIGQYTRPIESEGDIHVLLLLDHVATALAPFEQAHQQVEAEYLRRKSDQALRDYLAWLRQRTEITVASEY